ncbi:MAG: ComEA family DNA-binding protein [Propioniciclava sp.]|uniref:helix-hairpin-helix domain-containing protein n=1 Tax=Propioniciclava sp. TaxID=2038686 RepID=UPI0039E51BBF
MRKLARDPVQGDVVRARLDALVAELNDLERSTDADPGTREASSGAGAEPAHLGVEPRSGHASTPSEPRQAESGAASGGLPRARPSVARRVWEFGRTHAAVVGIIGLVAVLAATWTLTRSRTVAVADVTPSAVPATHAPAPSPSATPSPMRVHVLGAVATPGVVTLAQGARVEDALAAAGGFTPGARPGDLNLAAPVNDGDQIVVGDERKPGGEVRAADGGAGSSGGGGAGTGSGSSGAGGSAALDLNKATAEQLIALPGIGPVTAQAIVAWRTEHQKFSRVEELQEVDGIGPKTFAQLRPLVRV